MKCTIMIGASGSGKSTYAKEIDAVHCSADFWFSRSGEYKFDAAELPLAHAHCLRKFIEACQNHRDVLVDNTNTTVAEVAPYIAIALAHCYAIDVVVCQRRYKNIHDVPLKTLVRQRNQVDRLLQDWPAFWPYWRFHD